MGLRTSTGQVFRDLVSGPLLPKLLLYHVGHFYYHCLLTCTALLLYRTTLHCSVLPCLPTLDLAIHSSPRSGKYCASFLNTYWLRCTFFTTSFFPVKMFSEVSLGDFVCLPEKTEAAANVYPVTLMAIFFYKGSSAFFNRLTCSFNDLGLSRW